MKKIINTPNAPAAIGPYSQAVEANNTLYISGQLPVDPLTGTMPEGIEAQTRQCLQNVIAILEAANYSLSDVVKSIVLLADMGDFQAMNQVYATYYAENQPARVCYQVAKLPLGALVEIETIAVQ
jgi:2-iminobutanoate/2-iminopropanoate deaminase